MCQEEPTSQHTVPSTVESTVRIGFDGILSPKPSLTATTEGVSSSRPVTQPSPARSSSSNTVVSKTIVTHPPISHHQLSDLISEQISSQPQCLSNSSLSCPKCPRIFDTQAKATYELSHLPTSPSFKTLLTVLRYVENIYSPTVTSTNANTKVVAGVTTRAKTSEDMRKDMKLIRYATSVLSLPAPLTPGGKGRASVGRIY